MAANRMTLAPREPNEAMMEAGRQHCPYGWVEDTWRAMWDAWDESRTTDLDRIGNLVPDAGAAQQSPTSTPSEEVLNRALVRLRYLVNEIIEMEGRAGMSDALFVRRAVALANQARVDVFNDR